MEHAVQTTGATSPVLVPLRPSKNPYPAKWSFQARLFYPLKDSRDCWCGHQSSVGVLR